jgi:hypothetical protein
MNGATMTMARFLAKKAVKEEWRRQKINWVWVEPAELRRAADAYLEAHRAELVEKAKLHLLKS